jgi:putative peptide maturation dehydrogenase
MRIRRCGALLLDPRESLQFDLGNLLEGGDGLVAQRQWFALAPHLGEEVALDAAEVALLGETSAVHWVERDTLDAALADGLLAKGLLVADDDASPFRERDDRQRSVHWHPLAAVAHAFSRWRDVDSSDALTQTGLRTVKDMVDKLGAAPPHHHTRPDAQARVALPAVPSSALAELMDARTTCRNYDPTRAVPLALFAGVLHRVFAAHGEVEAAPDTRVVKKTSPSGGGLHATGAYLVVRHVEGVAPGLYHYHAGDHALEALACEAADAGALHALAQRLVAGQHWFADAHVLVVLAPRFRRSFWKYRNHAKAYRALVLDAGHLSQTLYLTATEHGLGAFITSAVNEKEIERVLGLDPLEEGPLAVCGFGWRGAERVTVEFDPLKRVWA